MKKNIFFSMLFAALFTFALPAEAQNKKTETITLSTSAVCGMCKRTIETALKSEKGVRAATLDLDTKEVVVTFNPKQTSAENIKRTISLTGYRAGDLAADAEAYEKLHFCCKADFEH